MINVVCGWQLDGYQLKWEEGGSLHPFFLHGYADGRPRATTNPQYNISTLWACWGKCVCADDQCCLWLAISWVLIKVRGGGEPSTTPSSSMATPTADLGPPQIHDIISLHWYLSQYSCSRDCPNFVTSHTHQPSTQFHIHQLANWNENISPPHLLMGAQPRLLYHSIPTLTERNASLKSGFQHFIPPFLRSFHTQQLTAPFIFEQQWQP